MFVVELTLPQFYLFLHEMEKAKSVMDYLTWLRIYWPLLGYHCAI